MNQSRQRIFSLALAFAIATSAGADARERGTSLSRERIIDALLAAGSIVAAADALVARHVCDLRIQQWGTYPVIDLVERIPSARVQHVNRRVVVLRPDLSRANELPYDPPARPIACLSNIVIFSAAVKIGNMPPEGKMVAFANDAGDMFIARIDHTLAKGAQVLGEDASGNPIAVENP